MSDREKLYQLLDSVPDAKIAYIIGYVQGITAAEQDKQEAETVYLDEWDLKMIAEAKKENDDIVTDIADIAQELGIAL